MAHRWETRRQVIKHTEVRDDAVYRTTYVCDVWVACGLSPEGEQAIAQKHGGDSLVVPSGWDMLKDMRRVEA